jgi:Nucleotidyl transferase AbiEii toxin, Type IV TA system
MTFRLHHHNKILAIVECLDCEVFTKGSAYFGGGTLLALDFEEYRWSQDIDFIASVGTEGYKSLRTVVFDDGHEALFRDLSKVKSLSHTPRVFREQRDIFADLEIQKEKQEDS